MPLVIVNLELKAEAGSENHAALARGADDYQILKNAADTVMQCGTSRDLSEALAQVPPGRTLAGEYLRQRRVIEEQQAQIVRAIELRVAADRRAGKRNVRALEERIEALEKAVRIYASAFNTFAEYDDGSIPKDMLQEVANCEDISLTQLAAIVEADHS